jgi:hypothetical protein
MPVIEVFLVEMGLDDVITLVATVFLVATSTDDIIPSSCYCAPYI